MRRRIGSGGGFAGLAGPALIAVGYLVIPTPPGPGASDLDVYAHFLDHRSATEAGAALALAGLILLAAFLSSLRARLGSARPRAITVALVAAGLAVAASGFALAALAILAIGAEDADPGGSRSALDLVVTATGVAGIAFAVMLGAAALALERMRGTPTRRLATLAAVASPLCLLWAAPLVTDADALRSGSLLGTTLGLAALLAWVVATARRVPAQ